MKNEPERKRSINLFGFTSSPQPTSFRIKGVAVNFRNLVALLFLFMFLISCTPNDVKTITNISLPSQNRAIIVLGLGVEGTLRQKQDISVMLHEYNLTKQSDTHICFIRYNHMWASVDNKPDEFRYFAFDVNPGYFATADYLSDSPKSYENGNAYEISAGKVNYLGDFIYSDRDNLPSEDEKRYPKIYYRPKITINNGHENALLFIKSLFPNFKGELVIPKPIMVKAPTMLLCAP